MNIIKTKRGYMGLCYCLRSVCIGSRTHFLDNTFFLYIKCLIATKVSSCFALDLGSKNSQGFGTKAHLFGIV